MQASLYKIYQADDFLPAFSHPLNSLANKNRKRNKKIISLDGICDAIINKTYNYGLTEAQ